MNATPLLPTIEVGLANGLMAELRPIHPGDGALLEKGLAQLSEESRFARFGIGINRLTNRELRYLTEVDLVNHVAWGAMIGGESAGVGRYIVLSDQSCAEVAVTVVDRFQRRGLGRMLFRALTAAARHYGLTTFCFEVEPSNEAVKRLLIGDIEVSPSGLLRGSVAIQNLPHDDLDRHFVELMELYRDTD